MYTFMKCLSWIICHIPEGCRRALGTFLGAFFWTFVPKKRKVLAQQQILDCGLTDDPEKAMAIAKASTARFGPMIIEVLSYPRYTKEMLDEKITWHGKEYLDELKASGEGAVFMASHAGNWELLGAVLAMNGYPLISVAQEQNSKSADTFINEYRAMMKQHVTYKTGIRDMVRFLREGHYIGLLMDQDPGYAGIMVKLFGMDTLTADGPAKMAGIANYPIVSPSSTKTGRTTTSSKSCRPSSRTQRITSSRKKKRTASCTKRHRNSTTAWKPISASIQKTGSGCTIDGNGPNGIK